MHLPLSCLISKIGLPCFVYVGAIFSAINHVPGFRQTVIVRREVDTVAYKTVSLALFKSFNGCRSRHIRPRSFVAYLDPSCQGQRGSPPCQCQYWRGARSTCPAHRNLPQRITVVMSARPSLSNSWSEGMSSWALTPQIHLTMERSFRQSRCSSEAFGPQVSLPWSIADLTQEL